MSNYELYRKFLYNILNNDFLRIVPTYFFHRNLLYNTPNHDVIQISSLAMTSTPPKKLLDLAGFDL
ncbi:hypothetical protein E5S67_03410 [Microcoleus sp. IPMA8]|uniref:Uncharacterized protein n=1 Tax=Microcoleus asticus IPMA8 TaxID=2563858 RepID=A0ABX2D1X6_9CYAN|nr:hypothetical protein [Microcoleus asticus IPMA8]